MSSDLSSSAVITGDSNTTDIDQIGNDNVLGTDILVLQTMLVFIKMKTKEQK